MAKIDYKALAKKKINTEELEIHISIQATLEVFNQMAEAGDIDEWDPTSKSHWESVGEQAALLSDGLDFVEFQKIGRIARTQYKEEFAELDRKIAKGLVK